VILRRDAKVKLISRVPLFEGCSGRELARVAAIAEQVEVPEGKVLIREGEPGSDFFAVVEVRSKFERATDELQRSGLATSSGRSHS
jgi:CRP-like cAMP-binding protein